MRTTLDIADDVLLAAKELAAVRRMTVGEVVSALARKGLEPAPTASRTRNGVPLLPRRPGGRRRPTMAGVNELRDAE
ncbi:MAG: CopG family transcriptional regulator [Vicinamibacterales bacterium]